MNEPSPLPIDRKNVKQPPLLFDETQAILRALEKQIGCKLLVYWTSDRGSVCDNDVIALYEIFKHIGRSEDIALFIKSNGGDVEAALRLVNLMREYNTRVHALVPLESASAATMIALGADEIAMGPLAHLTAIDSSLIHDMSPIDERNNRLRSRCHNPRHNRHLINHNRRIRGGGWESVFDNGT